MGVPDLGRVNPTSGRSARAAIHKILGKIAAADRDQPLYNTSKYDFEKLLGDPDNIARNLVAYIEGFSPKAKDILSKFDFETEIEKLDNANRLFLISKEFADPKIDVHPERVDSLQMGYVSEELVRKFNEQANEEAGEYVNSLSRRSSVRGKVRPTMH